MLPQAASAVDVRPALPCLVKGPLVETISFVSCAIPVAIALLPVMTTSSFP